MTEPYQVWSSVTWFDNGRKQIFPRGVVVLYYGVAGRFVVDLAVEKSCLVEDSILSVSGTITVAIVSASIGFLAWVGEKWEFITTRPEEIQDDLQQE